MPKAKRARLEIVPGRHPSVDDKRLFCRFVLPDVSLRFKDLRLGAKGEAKCMDFGGGGAGIEYNEEIKSKTPLELWFDLPDGFEPMHLLGRAVWSKPAGPSTWRVGIAFERQRLMDMARVLKLGG